MKAQILDALDLTDRVIEEVSDSALILAAYERWGGWYPERTT